jgi:NAD(P)-dependent dehydrogenase (short-subunit alcohol dehydrogenase family)
VLGGKILGQGKLDGRVALITGGGSGVGRAVALLFSREGARVTVVDLNRNGGETTVKMIKEVGGEALFAEADISRSSQVEKAVKTSILHYGKLDVLVNNAGIDVGGSVIELTEEAWDKVIDVNLKGVFLCSKYALAEMLKVGGGAVINIASVLGLVGSNGEAAYCASKGGIVALTKAMAIDLAKHNVRVNCICPGSVLTPMFEKFMASTGDYEGALARNAEKIPLGRAARPEEIARLALFLASDESSYATGSILTIDGGWTAR